jgi:hypothetical protein
MKKQMPLASRERRLDKARICATRGAMDQGRQAGGEDEAVELLAVARHSGDRFEERQRRAQCLKNPVPEAARTSWRDFWMCSSEPMIPIEENTEFR